MAALTLGMTVTFKHRHTYKAPVGQPLTGVVTAMTNEGNGVWSVSVYSEAAEMDYGMRPNHLRAVNKVPESAAVRLENLKRCDAAKKAHYAQYENWQKTFAEQPDYSFFAKPIATLTRELGA